MIRVVQIQSAQILAQFPQKLLHFLFQRYNYQTAAALWNAWGRWIGN
jgi:hypothetical protein